MKLNKKNPLIPILGSWGLICITLLMMLSEKEDKNQLLVLVSFIVVLTILGLLRAFTALFDKEIEAWRSIIYLLTASLNVLAVYYIFTPSIATNFHVDPEEMKTQGMIMCIKTAIMQYEKHYGEMPYMEKKRKEDIVLNEFKYRIVMELLSCKDTDDPGESVIKNSKEIRFLAANPEFFSKGCPDAWGNRYKIILDTNRDNKIFLHEQEIPKRLIIYSFGKNRKDDKGMEDDITSWEWGYYPKEEAKEKNTGRRTY